MTRYRMDIQYDGTGYAGWQIQPDHPTIQSTIENVIRKVTGEAVKLHGSGRTDQGVHARQQVAHFDLDRHWAGPVLLKAFNALLPSDIRAVRLVRTKSGFHARHDVVYKEYRYHIWNGPLLPPFLVRYRTHIRIPLDVSAMRMAAAHLLGRHDFAALTANPNREVESTVRDLRRLSVTRRGQEIVITAGSNGFLYKMVRSLAGVLIRVGAGELSPDQLPGILASRVRTARVPTAPPQGLFLWQVRY